MIGCGGDIVMEKVVGAGEGVSSPFCFKDIAEQLRRAPRYYLSLSLSYERRLYDCIAWVIVKLGWDSKLICLVCGKKTSVVQGLVCANMWSKVGRLENCEGAWCTKCQVLRRRQPTMDTETRFSRCHKFLFLCLVRYSLYLFSSCQLFLRHYGKCVH